MSSLRGYRAENLAFTLVELMVAIAVLVILLGLLLAITSTVSKTVLYTSSKIDAFATGRAGFDLMSQKLSQATLNTYWDYDNPAAPTVYYRQSDLQFLVVQNEQSAGLGQEVYFPAPENYSTDNTIRSTDGLLNACSFFVEYGPDTAFRPSAVSLVHYRYRLMQGLEPTESFAAYGSSTSSWPAVPAFSASNSSSTVQSQWTTYWTSWAAYWGNFTANASSAPTWVANISNAGTGTLKSAVNPLANNVIAMIVWPRLNAIDDPNGTKFAVSYNYSYDYDSQHNALSLTSGQQPLWANQMPPTVQVTMIVISEASATQIDTHSATQPTVIQNALNTRFADVRNYTTDLAKVSTALTAAHITFQVLNTTVTIKESKWSNASQ
jgi:uncharacterized protein (TIGR02599 family)